VSGAPEAVGPAWPDAAGRARPTERPEPPERVHQRNDTPPEPRIDDRVGAPGPLAEESASRYRWVILGLAVLSQASAAMAGQVIGPLAPLFQSELGMSKTEVGLFASATFAGAWSVMLVAGSVTDRFDIRRMLAVGQAVTGSLLLGMAAVGSAVEAAVVMFAAGMGRGTVFPGCSKAIMEWFPSSTRATAMGVKQTGAPLAGILAAATMPGLGLAFGWRTAIAIAGLFVIAGGAVTALLYRNPGQPAGARPAGANMRSGLKEILRSRSLWTLGCIALLYIMVQQSLLVYLALYLNDVVLAPSIPDEPTRILAAGGYLALCQFGGVFGRVFWGMVADRAFRRRRIAVLAIVGAMAAGLSVAIGLLASCQSQWLLVVVLIAAGVSVVGWNGVYHTVLTETAGQKYAGTAVGFGLTLVEAGTTMGPPIFGLILDLSGSYQVGWYFLAFLSAVGSLIALLAARVVEGPSPNYS